MKECPICGLVLPDWARKCPECEYEYEDMPETVTIPERIGIFHPHLHFKSEADKRFTIISVLVALLIIAIGLMYVAVFYSNPKEQNSKNTSTVSQISETFTESNSTVSAK